jgi:hypothetical protein
LQANGKRSRVVVITQGAKPTIVCQDGKISIHSIIELPKEKLVDTNGAGDAWVGGFLAALAKKGDVEVRTRARAPTTRTHSGTALLATLFSILTLLAQLNHSPTTSIFVPCAGVHKGWKFRSLGHHPAEWVHPPKGV